MDKVIKVVGLAELEQSLLIELEEARVNRGSIDGQIPNSTTQIRSPFGLQLYAQLLKVRVYEKFYLYQTIVKL